MSVIARDNYVAVEYRLWLDSGEQLRGTPEAPAVLTFIAGCNELMPGLERRLLGLRVQDAVEFTVPAADRQRAIEVAKRIAASPEGTYCSLQ